MQLKTLSILAFAGAAIAQDGASSSPSINIPSSDIAILATALPESLLLLAATNIGALATEINSQINDGEATWFTQLPTGVQDFLISVGENDFGLTASLPANTGAASASSGSSASGSVVVTETTGTSSASVTSAASGAGNATISTPSISGSSSKATGASAASSNTGAASSASTGGASLPTGVIGAGLAGALGIIGALAL